MFVWGMSAGQNRYRVPRNRSLEIRLVTQLIRDEFDKAEAAAIDAACSKTLLSQMLSGQAPLDLNRIACWPWRAKREFLIRLGEAWLREYLDNKTEEFHEEKAS